MAPQTKKGNTGQMIWYQGRERKQVMIHWQRKGSG